MDGANSLIRVISALHDSQINGEISWLLDGCWRVRIGDQWNGYKAEETVNDLFDAVVWFRTKAVELYPDSGFARIARESPSKVT